MLTYLFFLELLNFSGLKTLVPKDFSGKNALSYLFSNTTIAGGDTGSHVYIPYYLEQIFPLVKWWSPDWYSGFPFLYFYPPFMYIVTVVLGFLIPLNVAFKLVTISAVLIFPISAYLCFKWLKFSFPVPQLAAVFSLFLVFLEKYSIYGGNLPSTLAGQFSHTASIPLLFIFIGLFVRGFEKRKYIAVTLVGAATLLCHPISGMMMIVSSPFLLLALKGRLKERIVYFVSIFLGIFLLSAFWTLSLVFYKGYSGTMTWMKEIKWDNVFPTHWIFLSIGAGLGVLYGIFKKEVKLIPILGILGISSLAFLTLDKTSIWNTRFLPYISFIIFMMAAYFWGSMLSVVKKYSFMLCTLALIVISIMSFSIVQKNTSFSQSWFAWNYEGYQKKSSWAEIDSLFSYLGELPQGRVMWEYHPDYEKYGTTRVLETVPVFSGQSTYEGLLIESGLTGPFHFINQTETSEKPTAAIAGFQYPPFDFSRGIKHLQMSGANYFVAYSEKIKTEAEKENLQKMKDVGPFSIYKVEGDMISPVRNFTVELRKKGWLEKSIEWYKSDTLDTPIVFAKSRAEKEYLEGLSTNINDSQTPQNLKITNDGIEFDAPNVGVPYIVNISYFPTWRVSGARGPYLVSPAYMMVVPTQEHVRLYFSYGWVDWAGIVLSATGILYLFYVKRINNWVTEKLGNKRAG